MTNSDEPSSAATTVSTAPAPTSPDDREEMFRRCFIRLNMHSVAMSTNPDGSAVMRSFRNSSRYRFESEK
jgi:hypothetical protein